MGRPRNQAPFRPRVIALDVRDEIAEAVDCEPGLDPQIPPSVRRSALALEGWRIIFPVVSTLGVLTDADWMALGIYCMAYERHALALVELRQGVLVHTDAGGTKKNSAVDTARDCEREMLAILHAFRCTPASRKQTVKKDDQGDAFLKFLQSRAPKALL